MYKRQLQGFGYPFYVVSGYGIKKNPPLIAVENSPVGSYRRTDVYKRQRSQTTNDLLELTANYDKTIAEKHNLSLLLGLSQEENKYEDVYKRQFMVGVIAAVCRKVECDRQAFLT